MTEEQLTMPCGCQVGPASIGKGLELNYCGIHAYAPALFIEVLEVVVDACLTCGKTADEGNHF